jgi:hypothetical protein
MPADSVTAITRIDRGLEVDDLDADAWFRAKPLIIDRYWSGEPAPEHRHFEARLLWSSDALYVRFTAMQSEPLFISDNPDISRKSIGLWDRDVCEIFIAPDAEHPNKYFEFEVAPTGEWLDVAIEAWSDRRLSDWDYESGMQTAARIESRRVISAMRIEWKAFGKTPIAGDKWRGNLLRCVGSDPDRGYLAWQPTYTDLPSFHVPDRFGTFIFEP